MLATIAAGLYVSWNGVSLISAATRLQGIFFWDVLVYLIEGLVFLITGLQARALSHSMREFSLSELATSAAVVSLVVILARFIWIYPATYLPRRLIPAIARRDPAPPWQWPFALAFTGVRGIVSLAAALAVPLVAADGQPFPHRDQVLFLTYAVIVVTLVGQGLLLPTVIRALGLVDAGDRERHGEGGEEIEARRLAIESAIARLQQIAAEQELPADVLAGLHTHYRGRLQHFEHQHRRGEGPPQAAEIEDQIELLLISAERDRINELYRSGALKDEARRRIERELDLRQAHLANHSHRH